MKLQYAAFSLGAQFVSRMYNVSQFFFIILPKLSQSMSANVGYRISQSALKVVHSTAPRVICIMCAVSVL